MSKKIEMTKGSILPKILLFSLPLMLSSILQLLFNACDVVVVGKFAGSESLAAVSSTNALVNLIVNLFVGLSIGTNVIVARYIGARKEQDVKDAISTSLVVAVFGGILLAFIGCFCCRTMLMWMSTPDNVIDKSTLYLQIYFTSMPAMLVYNYGSAILRADGDTKRPLYFLAIAGVLNVLMNLVFVIVFHMDVAGVGLATSLSQYVSALLTVLYLSKEKGPVCLDIKQMHVSKDKLVQILKIGLPAGFQGMVFSFSNVVIQSSVNSFGSIVMAGNGAAANIEGFVYVAMNAFYQSCMTFTGQNIGAKRYDRINKILFTCLECVLITGVLFGVGGYLLGPQLLSIYSSELDVIAAGMIRLRYVCCTYALCGIMDVFVGSMRGMGFSVTPMVVSLLGACAFRIVWIYTLFETYHSMVVLYVSYPISWIITSFAHFICFVLYRKKYSNQDESMKVEYKETV